MRHNMRENLVQQLVYRLFHKDSKGIEVEISYAK